jgi:hypothetical protein
MKLLARSSCRRIRPRAVRKAVEPLLVDFVHVQEAVRRPSVECAILDVLAEHPGALLIAATKEAAAIVAVSWCLALSLIIVLMRHSNSRCEQFVRQFKIDYLELSALRYQRVSHEPRAWPVDAVALHETPIAGFSLVIELRYGAVRRMRAALAKAGMRHGNIRRH